jgi:hypothetical protein
MDDEESDERIVGYTAETRGGNIQAQISRVLTDYVKGQRDRVER